MMATTESIRARQRAEDDRRLKQWKSDKEVRPQVEAQIARRDARWAKEDKDAATEERVRAEIDEAMKEEQLRAKVLRELGRDAELVG